MYNYIEGGVCAPKGFKACGISSGIKSGGKPDLCLIVSSRLCAVAAVYSQSKMYSAPVAVTRDHISNMRAQAIICNSGNANVGIPDALENANKMCMVAAEAAKVAVNDVVISSTGEIGKPLPIAYVMASVNTLTKELSDKGGENAAEAILTSDREKKQYAVEFMLGEKKCRIGAIAKGSGRVAPNMATMLCFITTDAAVASHALQQALSDACDISFNMINLDGDTSCNDMSCIMSNGLAGNEMVVTGSPDFDEFQIALNDLCIKITRDIAADAEGSTKLIECRVMNAGSFENAKKIAKKVVSSLQVKTTVYGSLSSWQSILRAIGNCGDIPLNLEQVSISFQSERGRINVCKNSLAVDYSEERAKQIAEGSEIIAIIDCNSGATYSATAFGCDIGHDYIQINSGQ